MDWYRGLPVYTRKQDTTSPSFQVWCGESLVCTKRQITSLHLSFEVTTDRSAVVMYSSNSVDCTARTWDGTTLSDAKPGVWQLDLSPLEHAISNRHDREFDLLRDSKVVPKRAGPPFQSEMLEFTHVCGRGAPQRIVACLGRYGRRVVGCGAGFCWTQRRLALPQSRLWYGQRTCRVVVTYTATNGDACRRRCPNNAAYRDGPKLRPVTIPQRDGDRYGQRRHRSPCVVRRKRVRAVSWNASFGVWGLRFQLRSSFDAQLLPLLDRSFVCVVVCPRGGG